MAGPPSGPPSVNVGGIGAAGGKTQAAGNIMAVMQGLQQGYAAAQQKKFNQIQDAVVLAKTKYDHAVSKLNYLQRSGAQPDSEEYRQAVGEMHQADQEMGLRLGEMLQLIAGQKAGGKGKGGQGQAGQEGKASKLGDILHKIFYKASGGQSPLSPAPPMQTPNWNPNSPKPQTESVPNPPSNVSSLGVGM
jgi:hypothetical protein